MGGLDFQVEHHLAPRLPHTVYPLVSRRLDRVCAQRHMAVRQFASPWQALQAHARWLRVMGVAPDGSTGVRLEARPTVVDRSY
jgi:linoleoyl-CoA desaturase